MGWNVRRDSFAASLQQPVAKVQMYSVKLINLRHAIFSFGLYQGVCVRL